MSVDFEGDPNWWGGKIPEHLILNELHPEIIIKWKRKRLEPLLKKLLFPISWSLLVLTMGILFTLLDHRTNFSEYVGAILLILAPISLGLVTIKVSNSHQNPKPIHVLLGLLGRTRLLWLLIIIIQLMISIIQKPTNSMFWNLIILPSTILWIEWVAFGSFYFSSPSAIWITKYNSKNNLPMDELVEQGWEWLPDSLNPKNVSIAIKKSKKDILELSTINKNNEEFLVLSWWQKGGIRHDPFVTRELKGLAIPWLTKKLGYSINEFDSGMLDGIEVLEIFQIKS